MTTSHENQEYGICDFLANQQFFPQPEYGSGFWRGSAVWWPQTRPQKEIKHAGYFDLFLLQYSVKVDWHCSITKGKRLYSDGVVQHDLVRNVMYVIYMVFSLKTVSITSVGFLLQPWVDWVIASKIATITGDFTDMPTERSRAVSFFPFHRSRRARLRH